MTLHPRQSFYAPSDLKGADESALSAVRAILIDGKIIVVVEAGVA